MELNEQPIEKADLDPKGNLEVHSIFDTVQGEGFFAGTPAIFIRLAGCNLQCHFCDTDYTSERATYTPDLLLRRILHESAMHNTHDTKSHRKLIVITGGEPFRQNIAPLTTLLITSGFKVQIETNGTLPAPERTHASCRITCSPKTAKVHPHMFTRITDWKYIIEEGKVDPRDGLPTSALGMPTKPARPPASCPRTNIFVQPLDSKDKMRNKMNLEAAVESCRRYGYRLSVQLHKLAGLE